MRLATVKEIQSIDRMAQEKYSLPAEVLMETAGFAAAQVLLSKYVDHLNGQILILAGPGNNGGDGLVIARALYMQGYKNLKIFMPLPIPSNNDVFQTQLERIKNLKIDIVKDFASSNQISVVVDCLFGVGLARNLNQNLIDIVNQINALDCFRFAVDVPSGLDADTGAILGAAIKSHATITFGLSKVGFYIQEGPETVGDLIIQNIGFPQELLESTARSCTLIGKSEAKKLLKPESNRTNKVKRGKLLVIAGSASYWGAGLLACQAALRSGAGYVYWASFENPISQLPTQPELIVKPLDQIQDFSVFDAVVVGPGLGVSPETHSLLKRINNEKVIVDADALNAAAKYGCEILKKTWAITPHTGELSRLIQVASSKIEENRIASLEKAFELLQCNILLKGFRSLLKTQDHVYIISSGNKALAKAGSGDVLAGMAGAFACGGQSCSDAVILAAFIHGYIADNWIQSEKNARSLAPSDIKEEISNSLNFIETDYDRKHI